jgi:hypothetical protein
MPEAYVPARKHPVWPAVRESSSFCTVRYGLVSVPLLLSEPDGAATRSQLTAADASDGADANTTMIATTTVNTPAKRAARTEHGDPVVFVIPNLSAA